MPSSIAPNRCSMNLLTFTNIFSFSRLQTIWLGEYFVHIEFEPFIEKSIIWLVKSGNLITHD
jgi:hypothetical protein